MAWNKKHTVGIEVTVIEHKDFLGLEHVEDCHEFSITNLQMLATTLACQHDMALDDNKEWISSTRYGINFITSVRGGNGHFRWGQDPNMHVSLERNLAVPNNKWKSTTCVTFILKMSKESHVGIIEKTPRLLQLEYMVDVTFNPVVMFELHVG